MELFDTHCHLSSLKHAPLEQILADARAVAVTGMVCIGASEGEASAQAAVEIAEEHEGIWASVGIHPHDAGSYTDLSGVEHLLSRPKVVAVGETGLDFYRDWAPADMQRTLFRNTIRTAKNVNKPLIIHCRDAAEETFAILKEEGAESVGGVFHCYAEDAEFAERLTELNFIVSFPGTLTFKRAENVRAAAKAIPLERIMLETDCPYMAPEPFRGQPSEPKHVLQIAQVLAEVKGLTLEEIAAQTTANAKRLFGI